MKKTYSSQDKRESWLGESGPEHIGMGRTLSAAVTKPHEVGDLLDDFGLI